MAMQTPFFRTFYGDALPDRIRAYRRETGQIGSPASSSDRVPTWSWALRIIG